MGKDATKVGTRRAETLRGTRGRDVIVASGGSDVIYGRRGSDIICAGGGDDIVFGQAGNDLMKGGTGIDILVGMQGSDWYRGDAGFDLAAFLASSNAVRVDLAAGSAAGEGNDTLPGMEGAVGSSFDDTIFGDSATNVLVGGSGNDLLDGRAGSDFVFYTLAQAAVGVDLTERSAVGGEDTDSLVAIENVVGSPHDDTLIGTPHSDYLNGAEGFDTVDGRGGEDACFGEELNNCPMPLPTTAEPPSPVTSSMSSLDPQAPPPDPKTARAAPYIGGLSCPFLAGSFGLTYPTTLQGYSFYAYRLYGGSWVYSPLLYYQSYWEAYVAGRWWTVTPYDEYYVGERNNTVEAYWYHYASGQYYFMGECTTRGFSPGI